MKAWIGRFVVLVVLAGGGYAAFRAWQQMPQRQEGLPVFTVRRGDVVVRSFTRGELRAVRSATLIAPNLFGLVQITKLAQTGALAKPGDLIGEFDESEVKTRVEEKELEVEQTDEQIKKQQADLAMRANQDQVELLSAGYAVRRAELEVKRNELLSSIDAKKNMLTLDEARRRLQQLESDVKSRKAQAEAELAVLEEKRRKAHLELDREKERLLQVRILAPMAGLVALKQNRLVNFNFGQQLPDWREGDQVQPGMPVADILDLSDMEVVAKVNELDRANLREGQAVLLRLDALPGQTFRGAIKSMSATAQADVFSADPVKRFEVTFSLNMKDLLSALGAKPAAIDQILKSSSVAAPVAAKPAKGPGDKGANDQTASAGVTIPGLGLVSAQRLSAAQLPEPPGNGSGLDVLLRPGLLVDVEIILSKAENVLHIPSQAVFERDGKQVVYVRQGPSYVAHPIAIQARSESTFILKSGVSEGDVIAMQDPFDTKKPDKQDKKATGGAGPLAGGK